MTAPALPLPGSLAVVCPMANEAGSAERFVRDVLTTLAPYGFRQLAFFAVLDRACTDGTVGLLQLAARTLPALKVVYAPENRGVVDAYVRGYREALAHGAELVLEIDAGYSHDPREIPRFIEALASADAVFATRFGGGGRYEGGLSRRWLVSRGGSALVNLLLGTRLSDMTSGFQLFRRAVLQDILALGLRSRGPFFQSEMKVRAHAYRIAEVPITYRPSGQVPRSPALRDAWRTLLFLFLQRLSRRTLQQAPSR